MSGASWLKEIVILNENSPPHVPGDVQIFRSAIGVCYHLEPWFVGDVDHMAISGIGDLVILGASDNHVYVERTEPFSEGLGLLREWLVPTAIRIHQERSKAEKKKPSAVGSLMPDGVMPDTIEGLIAYIGFEN
jgi:hypothetical protein